MLGEHDPHAGTPQLRERAIDERRVMVAVENVGAVLSRDAGERPPERRVESAGAAQRRRLDTVAFERFGPRAAVSSRQHTAIGSSACNRLAISTTSRSVPPGFRLSTTCSTRGCANRCASPVASATSRAAPAVPLKAVRERSRAFEFCRGRSPQ